MAWKEILFYVTLRPNADHGLPNLEVYRTHTQRRTMVGMTPLDEWSACRRDLYLTTQTILTRNRHQCPRRDSNPWSQQASGRRTTPQNARPLGSAVRPNGCPNYELVSIRVVMYKHISHEAWRRNTNKMQQYRWVIVNYRRWLMTNVSTCFEHLYAHHQEKRPRVTAYGVVCW